MTRLAFAEKSRLLIQPIKTETIVNRRDRKVQQLCRWDARFSESHGD